VVYKGMLTTDQLVTFFPDLHDERTATAMALVHSRFSTNTFPSWPLAHPFRYIAHNGEINTIKGNRNWMRAREALLETDAFGARAVPTADRAGCPGCCRCAPTARPTRRPSTRCSSCCTCPAAACRTRC
jgi:glutamate synthase domain-containing protein 1